jgi:probable HAF family extracellular repeat protein
LGINDQGQIVGFYNDGGDHGFLYDPNGGTYTRLDAP